MQFIDETESFSEEQCDFNRVYNRSSSHRGNHFESRTCILHYSRQLHRKENQIKSVREQKSAKRSSCMHAFGEVSRHAETEKKERHRSQSNQRKMITKLCIYIKNKQDACVSAASGTAGRKIRVPDEKNLCSPHKRVMYNIGTTYACIL